MYGHGPSQQSLQTRQYSRCIAGTLKKTMNHAPHPTVREFGALASQRSSGVRQFHMLALGCPIRSMRGPELVCNEAIANKKMWRSGLTIIAWFHEIEPMKWNPASCRPLKQLGSNGKGKRTPAKPQSSETRKDKFVHCMGGQLAPLSVSIRLLWTIPLI